MVKRTVKGSEQEPEQMAFEMPSEKEHLFQVVDIFDFDYEGNKFNLDPDTVIAKLEVCGGDEEGRTMLNRLSLDDGWKGFFATRLFLKAIGEEYKGDQFAIDTDAWVGRQFYATVKHAKVKDKTYANIGEYNFDKVVEQVKRTTKAEPTGEAITAWDDDL
jgi:hypothetical protein